MLFGHFVTRQSTMYAIFQAKCNGEIDECHNGGTMIWDPVKTFNCVCKEGYRGELCNIGNIQIMHY